MNPRALASWAPALAAALIALALNAAFAGAQEGVPGSYDELENRIQHDENVPDTDYTPKYDDPTRDASKLWLQVGGARFRDADDPAKATESVGITSYEDNLYDIAFRNDLRGLAVGARCGDPDPDAEKDCRPVVYLYEADVDGEGVWTKVDLPGGDQPGFVGAVDWIDPDRAMVVGGTGTYPRWEPPYDPDCQAEGDRLAPWNVKCDPAGMARVWMYDSTRPPAERWCEARVGEENGFCPPLPKDSPSTRVFEGMRGLTAVGFKPDADPEVGFVGALGQIFRWDGRGRTFDKRYDNYSDRRDVAQPAASGFEDSAAGFNLARVGGYRRIFRFRVRDLRFPAESRIRAYAVTSGCCSASDTSDVPATLTYTDYQPLGSGLTREQWVLRPAETAMNRIFQPYTAPAPDPGFAVDVVRNESRAEVPDPPGNKRPAGGPPAPHQSGVTRIDSLYSLTTVPGGGSGAPLSLLATTASTDSAVELRSAIFRCVNLDHYGGAAAGGYGGGSGSAGLVHAPVLIPFGGAARLVGMDGPTPSGNTAAYTEPTERSCAAGPDWAVGELRTARVDRRGRRGLVLSAHSPERQRPSAHYPPPNPPEKVAEGRYRPTDEQRVREHLRARDQLVSSYTLNAVDMVLDTGSGWAVGDHGAILHLDTAKGEQETTILKAEPEVPDYGPRERRDLPDTEPLDAQRPAPAAAPGLVPGLASQPLEGPGPPRVESLGSPDATQEGFGNWEAMEDVGRIAMSRDGSEGWAVGTNPKFFGSGSGSSYGRISLYHYSRGIWRRCDPAGIRGQLEAEPACAGLGAARDWRKANGAATTARLSSLARIPYEQDGDPDNDDDFGAYAIGSQYRYGAGALELPLLARLEDGRWRVDPGLTKASVEAGAGEFTTIDLIDVGFTAPDDGWILGRNSTSGGLRYHLFHYDGEGWSLCKPDTCGGARVPATSSNGTLVGLTTAGDRVYVYGWRPRAATSTGTTADSTLSGGLGPALPLIVYRDRRKKVWTDGSGAGEDGGGYDPGFDPLSAPDEQGRVLALSVAQRPDGRYIGWAVGRFFDHAVPPDILPFSSDPGTNDQHTHREGLGPQPTTVLMRLHEDRWSRFRDPGALTDLTAPFIGVGAVQDPHPLSDPRIMATLGDGSALIGQRKFNTLFAFGGERFEAVRVPRPGFGRSVDGHYQAIAPDGRGGFWLAVKNVFDGSEATGGEVYFFRYTPTPQTPVFREVPHPLGGAPDVFTALGASADGVVWAGTSEGQLARYDRVTGWQVLGAPRWDPGRIVTRRSAVNAIAVNAEGVGLAVGPRGRIANLTRTSLQVDEAAGRRCAFTPEEPCGTGYDLHAAAVSPNGSALAGGNALTVLYRPGPDGRFRRVTRPPGNPGNRVTGISFPTDDRAYLVTDGGYAYRGTLAGTTWTWTRENRFKGETIGGDGHPLRAIAIDADGHGYAVGDAGMLLERTGEADRPWRRRRGPGSDHLRSIVLTADGKGALVGADNGAIWTLVGAEFEVARPADYTGGGIPQTGPVVGVAIVPGLEEGQVEAWAASAAPGPGANRLFHHSSDPGEPLLDPTDRAEALPDAPAARPGELTIGTFGNSDCDSRTFCPIRRGASTRHEVLGDRILDALRRRGVDLTLFTGDSTWNAGMPASSTQKTDKVGHIGEWNFNPVVPGQPSTDFYGGPEQAMAPVMQRQWNRMVADPLEAAGIPLFGAPGPGDLSRVLARCDVTGCGPWAEETKTGDNLTWRDTMEVRRAPWGKDDRARAGGLTFEPVRGADESAQSVPNMSYDPDGKGPVPAAEVKGGARTHYAVDVVREGRRVVRLVTLDTSLRSLQASDPLQQPIEQKGQLQWLDKVACFEGDVSTSGEACTRDRAQPLVVLTNTPTYSHTGSVTETNAVDGVQLEATLMRHRATAVVSGRVGQSTLYWATAPGVHLPCPGGGYRGEAPEAGQRVCVGTAASGGAERHVAAVLKGLGAPPPPTGSDGAAGGLAGVLPFVVSATAGGRLGLGLPGERQESRDGFWSGYSLVRVPADGDPTKVIVEQRPVLDWVSLRAAAHVLRPGQKLRLDGIGREPVARNARVLTRFHRIDSDAITHRYDLVEADPAKPWLPKVVEGNGNPHGYVPLDPQAGTVDSETGRVIAGRGTRGRVHAIAVLSVGAHSATWPLVFEPRRSFTPPPPRKLTIPPPLPPIRVLGIPAQAVPSQPPPAPPATPPIAVDLVLPPPPAIPGLPGTTPSPIAPPIPPVSPPPPTSVGQTASGLAANPLAILLAPTAAPIPPSSPLIQPAPPSGARREARQKQAATAKSEEGASEAREGAGDPVDGPPGPGHAFVRRDRVKAAPVGFTPRAHPSQPSAWVTGLQYGGGTALMALVLALGWTTVRPTPRGRRREDVDPAPAWLRDRR